MDPKVNELQSIITDTFKSRFSDIKKRSIGKETKNSVSSLNFLQMVDKDHPHNYIEYIMSPEEVRT